MESVSAGILPLINPYSNATLGGQPLLANGQSGFFYPLHWPIWFLPKELAPFTFVWLSWLQTLLMSLGVYRLATYLRLSREAACTVVVAVVLSSNIWTWITLPTHLSVITWLPWLWFAAFKRNVRLLILFTVLTLTAGHLQLATYSILSTLSILILTSIRVQSIQLTLKAMSAVVVGSLVSLIQLIPSIELSRVSHRGGTTATLMGYQAYIANALPIRHLITLVLPDYFGHPTHYNGNNWIINTNGVSNNYAEWAIYCGAATIILGLVGLTSIRNATREFKVVGVILVASLLIALGTPLAGALYFGVPGFSGTGNPGRILILFILGLALFAGYAIDQRRTKFPFLTVPIFLLLSIISVADAKSTILSKGLSISVTDALQTVAITQQLPILLLTIFVVGLVLAPNRKYHSAAWLVPVLLVADLHLWGTDYNPIGPVKEVIKVSQGLTYLRNNARNEPIACLVKRWSMGPAGPTDATLPPNLLSLWQLHDIGMYDSLLIKSDKEYLESLSQTTLMPPENGNLLRIADEKTAFALGAAWIITPPLTQLSSRWVIKYSGPDMNLFERVDKKTSPVKKRTGITMGLRFGMFASLFLLAFILTIFAQRNKQRSTSLI